MLTIWSPKGGSGTSVVAASVALHLARRGGARLVDLDGAQPALLGMASEPETGVLDWLAVPGSPVAALDRLGVEAVPGLVLVPRGRAAAADRPEALAAALASGPLPTVVDAGTAAAPPGTTALDTASAAVVVLEPCYLALRKAVADPRVALSSGLVVVEGPHHTLSSGEVARVVGVRVLARLPLRKSVARAVDAGTLASHLPEPLVRVAEALAPLAEGSPAWRETA